MQSSATIQVRVYNVKSLCKPMSTKSCSKQARKSHVHNKTVAFSWKDSLWKRRKQKIRWICHKMTQPVLPEGWGRPTWPLKDVPCHLKARWGEMPTQHLALTQQNDVGLQSDIKVVLKWKQFDIAREENEEMRLMLWGEWVGGGMRKRKSVEVESCIVGVFCWNGTQALTRYERDCFLLKTVDPTANGRGERVVWEQ